MGYRGGFKAAAIALCVVAGVLAGCADDVDEPAAALPGTGGKSTSPGPAPTAGAERKVTMGTALPQPGSIYVQWNVPEGDENTVSWVEYGLAGALDRQSLRQNGPGQHQVMLGDLQPGTAYNYRIIVLRGEEATRTALQSFATSPGSPSDDPAAPPVDLDALRILAANAPTVRSTSANIMWTVAGGIGAVSSLVEYGTQPDFGLKTDANFGRGTFVANLPTLAPGVVYYYRILARDTNGTVPGATQTFMTPLEEGKAAGTAPPVKTPEYQELIPDTTPPVITQVTNTDPSGSAIGFYWTVSDDIDPETLSYIHYGIASTLGSEGGYQVGLGERFGYIDGLSASTTYFYRIVARDRSGNAAQSDLRTFTTPDLDGPTCPAPVITNVVVPPESVGTSSIRVSWTAMSSCPDIAILSRAEVKGPNDPDFARSTRFLTGQGDKAATMTGLQPKTTYTLRVSAYDSLNQRTLSLPLVTFTTLPAPYIEFLGVEEDTVLEDRFTVHWLAVGPADSETWLQWGDGAVLNNKMPSFPLRTVLNPLENYCVCQTTLTGLTAQSEYNFGLYVTGSRGLFTTAPPPIKQATAKVIPIALNETVDPTSSALSRQLVPGPALTLYFERAHIFEITNQLSIAARWEMWTDEDCDPSTPAAAPYGQVKLQTDVLTPASFPSGTVTRVPRDGAEGPPISVKLSAGVYCMRALDIGNNVIATSKVLV